jgi:hypothetical protein
MRRLFVRARRVLLVGIPLALAVALSCGTTARATTVTAAVSSTECSFNPVVLCQSTDSTITLNVTYTGASACTFVWNVAWGDGGVSKVTNTDPTDGPVSLGNYLYSKTGTYTISATGQVTAGNCTTTPFTGHFSLVAPTVALGDSYSSGEGDGDFIPGTDTSTDKCHRSYNAYPELLYVSQNLGYLNFVSCSGATTDDYFNANKSNNEAAQSQALSSDTMNVTLTFGGNDIGFSDVLSQCTYGKVSRIVVHGKDCSGNASLKAAVAKRLQALAGKGTATTPKGVKIHSIASILQSIHKLAPNATIYVAGYPLLFGTNIRTDCGVGTVIADGIHVALKLSKPEVKWLNSVGTSLDNVIKSAAAANGATFVDVNPLFNSHRFCDTSKSWFNPVSGSYGLKSGVLNLSSGSFHPTSTGQKSGYEAAFEAAAGWVSP